MKWATAHTLQFLTKAEPMNINKIIEDYKAAKKAIHYDMPPIEILNDNEIKFGFDVSVLGNGERLFKIIKLSTIKLFIKDLLGLMSDKMKGKLIMNYNIEIYESLPNIKT